MKLVVRVEPAALWEHRMILSSFLSRRRITLISTEKSQPVATNDQVRALVKSHAEGDDSQFYSLAMQIAANWRRC